MWPRRASFALLLAAALAALPAPAPPARAAEPDDPADDRELDEPPRSYLGLAYTGAQDLPAGLAYRRGAVLYVYETTPAYRAGLRSNDVLVKIGESALDVPPKEVLSRAKELVQALRPGEAATLELVREGKVMPFVVTPTVQPPRFDRIETRAAWLRPDAQKGAAARVLGELAKGFGAEARVADTLARLRASEARRDAFRLKGEVEAHVRPFENEALARELAKDLADPLGAFPWLRSMKVEPPRVPAALVARLLEAPTLDELASRIGECLAAAEAELAKAYRNLGEDDRKHLRAHFRDLGARLAETFAIDMDAVPEREARNRRTLDLLKKVDVKPLGDALAIALATVDPGVLKRLAALADASPKRAEPLILAKDTPGGRVEIDGLSDDVHTVEVAYRFDLGGNDRYLDVGGAASFDVPIAITVDWDGDDLYTATTEGRQGAGIFGIGILIDRAGNDRYVASRFSQGVGVGGVGILLDLAGNDTYRLAELGQGLGLRGLGYLRDGAGDDRYEACRAAQGVGLPGGIGVLRDDAGDDRYFCGGRDPSGYGTPGVFEGWGQGVGVGLRGVASGGIGLLHDLGGRDVYEAGNFAQGGGYFYGWGILIDEAGDDRYLGARYAQGFGCHQAVGTFIERAGNDRYETIDGAAAGLAWDESTAVFHDEGGNDQYLVSGFSLAAAAHNGFALFLDDDGNDVYRQTPAGAADNSYHGGSSVALFLDGGGKNRYLDGKGADDRIGWRGEDAFFVQMHGGGLAGLLKRGNLLEGK
jgi:hypothetical protein